MPKHNRILVPIDLSENSYAPIDLATTLAEKHGAKMVFVYVTALWNPEETKFGGAYVDKLIETEKTKLYKLRPTSAKVEFEHHTCLATQVQHWSKNAKRLIWLS